MDYRIIGKYKPPFWRAWKVGKDITRYTKGIGLIPLPLGTHRLHKGSWRQEDLHSDVMRRTPPNDTSDLDWHRDGDMTGADQNCALVVWSTNNPTEVKLSDGTIIIPKPYEIIIFNNRTCKHRRPPQAPHKRWLFRQRVQLPTYLKEET